VPSPLFTGPSSIRHPGERLAFVWTLVFAFPIASLIGVVLHEAIGIPEVALFLVIAMLYVTLARGRLIGSSVMIHEAQYPRVFAIVRRACAALEIPMPLVFVREDYNVPAAALGFGEPYALVVSSHWIEHFEDDELAFVVGRQLGHIAAGHARYLSLLSVNGNENPVVSLIFGPWLRTCDYTCDLVGLLVCGSLDAATRAIAVTSFHHFGRHVNVAQFAEQGTEIAGDPVLRLGEWLGAEPYATNRIANMRKFESSARFEALEAWFLREVAAEPPALPARGEIHVERGDCAGWWRRALSVCIDLVVVVFAWQALTMGAAHERTSPAVININPSPAAIHSPVSKSTDSDDDDTVTVEKNHTVHYNTSKTVIGQIVDQFVRYLGGLIVFPIYMALLVGLVGQTFGMMITGLRVVTVDFRSPGIWRSIWRYCLAYVLWPYILLISPIMQRVMVHDRWSGTRLITSERVLARSANRVNYSPG
jgi:Zn-dependent protease with chaperone function